MPSHIRRPKLLAALLLLGVIVAAARSEPPVPAENAEPTQGPAENSRDVNALRAQARLLHDTMHATLHTVHHRYYREDEGLIIPAVAMKQVFDDVRERHQVRLRWLAVDAQAMNSDHVPRDDFEKQAVSQLASGKPDHEQIEGELYRRVAPIRLSNECLKCHLPNRTSTADRKAALIVEIPLGKN